MTWSAEPMTERARPAVQLAASLIGALALATAAAMSPRPAAAQGAPQGSAVERLNDALHNLARDPTYVPSLIAAGRASLTLEDTDAALGFFRRAELVAPTDGRVKAGLASVMVRQGQPVEALRLFQQAEQSGEFMAPHAAERGLAYDLVGDNIRAQQDYRLALASGPDPVVTRRLALSQAIAGDRNGSEATLLPLLQQTDLAAYRTRAFALAILGEADEAVSIVQDMMPAQISSRMAPYLRYMPRLTNAQQAAAANLGRFPQAAQIGREDPALAALAAPGGSQPPARVTADARLVPSGAPLGPFPAEAPAATPEEGPRPVATAPAQGLVQSPMPAPVPAAAPPPSDAPVFAAAPQVVTAAEAGPVSLPQPASTGEPTAQVVQTAAAMRAPEPLAPLPPVGPAEAAVAMSELVEPAPRPDPAFAAPPSPRDLAQAFADFAAPPAVIVPAQWAVDITQIEPKREAAAKPAADKPAPVEAAPPKPVVPSRHWVQVATGRDTKALAFDWRRVKREAGGLLDKASPHIAAWGQTHRLIAGPFASAREANELVGKLKGKEVDSFRFTSARGEDVEPLE